MTLRVPLGVGEVLGKVLDRLLGKEISIKRLIVSMLILIVLILCMFFLIGFISQRSKANSDSGLVKSDDKLNPVAIIDPAVKKASKLLESMTLEQKVAQLFVITPEVLSGSGTVTVADESMKSALASYTVGGVIFFSDNLTYPSQTKELIANMQTYAIDSGDVPLFTAVDEEGGTVARVGSNSAFGVEYVGNMSDIGASGDTKKAKAAAVTIGTYLKDLGFNLDFAPDADICGDTSSDVMALRSFGTDAKTVSDMVKAQVKGFLSVDMLCCAKHFPGIGGVSGDSHDEAIVSNKSLDDLRNTNLVPFNSAIGANIPFIMVGHLSLPEALGNNTPASINSAVVTDLLREEMGFKGIIITDSMSMSAVTQVCESDQVGVEAIKAGVDMILMPSDFKKAYKAVLDAVKNGDISEERIDESVQRILQTKFKYLEW